MNANEAILNQKLELIQWLSTIEDSAIIQKIMDLRKKESTDWWNSISENEKQSIELGLEDAESGKLNEHSEARALYKKWL
ncbi:hypothetical protein [Flavobacterium polysaccharolyticum]|uniref:Addiction module component n=1 Tax=Flavobacterium polysaccharolyticum TaxID=3133148 RepID=A0ABU9NSH6_9FLAO